MQKAILILFAILGVVYFLFYPFLRKLTSGKKIFRWFLIIYILAAILSSINHYFL